MRRLRLLLVLLVLAPGVASSQDPRQPPMPLFPYKGQGRFVLFPALFVSSPVAGAGFVAGALLCAPISLALDPRMEGKVPHDKQPSLVCGRAAATALGWPVYAAAGLPFFLLKGLFWDAPRAAAGALRGPPVAAGGPVPPARD